MKKTFLISIAALLLTATAVLASNSEPLTANASSDGSYLVSVYRDGSEEWIPMSENTFYGGGYQSYPDFFVVLTGSRAHFYFSVDGQKYGAPTEDQPLFLGVATQNQLVPYDPSSGDELYCYTTDAGYSYSICLYPKYNEDMELTGYYVQPARGDAIGSQTELGDVNLDFKVNIDDVTALIDYLLIDNPSYYVDKYNADVDQDGAVTISDVTELIDKLLGKEKPEDSHGTGYWLVMIQSDNTKEYVQLILAANGDYVIAYDVVSPPYGETARFYYLIDGVPYYASEDAINNEDGIDETEAYLGNPIYNPLTTEGNKTYFIYSIYSYYYLGVHIVRDNETMEVKGYYAYVAQGGYC